VQALEVRSPPADRFWRVHRVIHSFAAAAKATKTVYGVEPDYTREGGSCVAVLCRLPLPVELDA
jgi:hypothetical protein